MEKIHMLKQIGFGKIGCGWLGIMAVLAAALFYWSWCWGWWGRQNCFIQKLLQCQCPPGSEEARYPEDLDVLLSACVDPYYGGNTSPSGRYSLVSALHPVHQQYLYDRETDQLTPIAGNVYGFLTDEIVWGEEDTNLYFLYDLAGNKLVQLNWKAIPIDTVNRDYLPFDQDMLNSLRRAEKIYVVSRVLAIALSPNFQEHPETNLALEMEPIPTVEYIYITDTIAVLLQENGFQFEVVSSGPTPLPPFYTSDKAIRSVWEGPCWMSQPLLRRRLPLNELAPEVRPRVIAQRLWERVVKFLATLPAWIAAALILAAVIKWWQRHRRAPSAAAG